MPRTRATVHGRGDDEMILVPLMDREHTSNIILLLAVILVVLVGIWIELMPAERRLDSVVELPGWVFFLGIFGVVMLLGGAGAMVAYARDELSHKKMLAYRGCTGSVSLLRK